MKSGLAAWSVITSFSGCPICLVLFLTAAAVASPGTQNPDRVNLFPKLSVGQVFRYRIGYRADTHIDTESSVVAPMAPTGGHTDVQLHLLAEVTDFRLDAGKPLVRIRTRINETEAVVEPATPSAGTQPRSSSDDPDSGKIVEFSLHADGQITDADGLDKLSAEEQAAWQEWLSRFAAAGVYPEKGVKPGDKWKADEPIPSSILAALSWEKESEYVNDTSCGAVQLTAQGDPASVGSKQDSCAVILTTATLKQKSSAKDATPEDYKLHDLRTMGTASGKNEIISYISLKSGLLVRATEDAHQTMNAIVAKSDGSNRVHYTIEAESHAQVLLLASSASNSPH
ncbi:MAG TPA: hypothetical protein VE077_10885 [Candidatus Methylomirabilis sp.]|nr:hypothetical protein [Candidatus Methylomirabilis sp.]